VFLTVRHGAVVRDHAEGLVTICNAYGLIAVELALARIVLGTALLVVWPAALWVGLSVARPGQAPVLRSTVSGLFLAALAYLASWAPAGLILVAPVVPAVAALAILLGVSRLGWGRAVLAWVVQGVLVVSLSVATFISIEGTGPIKEAPAIARYVVAHDTVPSPGVVKLPVGRTPVAYTLTWVSTGSRWLDSRARRAEITLECPLAGATVVVELRKGPDLQVYQEQKVYPFTVVVDAEPGTTHHLQLTGPEGTEVGVTVSGVLTPESAC